ncbi:hypothetical protein CVT26_006983 [Gymnopilus dilepis]|uniref:DUF6534 domain-containing protein n=1 Tax=Gymnopilus dilepis TaxID=231916 RepID=A0A409W176_9AGAR|nr:hypothetical protein CVT26_006983 [Gymnopilus dilepis]
MGYVDSTLGAVFVGFNISCVVFGVLTTQAYVYFQRFPLDRLPYKILVASLWCLELLDQVFIAYSVYFYAIKNFANPLVILRGKIIWTLIIQIMMGNLVGTIVKCCFAMRVWRFSKHNIYITGAIMIMILVQFGLAILYCVEAFRLTSLIDVSHLRLTASLALSAGPVTDILIAAALCYFLRKLRTGHRNRADTLVRSLSIYAINTGALTGAISSLTLILYNAQPDAFYFMASYFTLGKLYAISFLAALNTRKVVRGKGTDQEGDTSGTRNTFFLVTNNGRVPRTTEYTNHTKSVEIDIHQEVSVVRDVEEDLYTSPKFHRSSSLLRPPTFLCIQTAVTLLPMVDVTIDNTLGACFIGFAVACGLYGIVASQTFSYFRNYPGDKNLYKALVLFIFLLETADQCFIGHLVYFYAITNYADVLVLLSAKTTWSFILQLTVGAVAGCIVKTYFAFRVWRFSHRNYWITGLILLLAFGQLGLALAFTVKAFKLPDVFAVHNLQTLGTLSLGVGVCTDIITAGALCIFLNRLRTGLKSSDNLVNNLCTYAINTGVLTSTVSVATLILYNSLSYNFYFAATYFILSKLYAISFLATLNTRRSIRGRGTEEQGRTSNNTNMFHLGTRMPSMGPNDLQHWDKVDPPVALQQRMQELAELRYQGRSVQQ